MADIRVQVCYARPDMQILRELLVPEGASLQTAIEQSEVLSEAPEVVLSACRVGIHGKLKMLETALRDGDRVEIYRPLLADPKDSRRRRAATKSNKGR